MHHSDSIVTICSHLYPSPFVTPSLSQELVEEAEVLVEDKLKEKRKLAKKSGHASIEEDDDPEKVSGGTALHVVGNVWWLMFLLMFLHWKVLRS